MLSSMLLVGGPEGISHNARQSSWQSSRRPVSLSPSSNAEPFPLSSSTCVPSLPSVCNRERPAPGRTATNGRKRRLLSVRPERSRRVCAGAVIRLRSARTGGGAALRLGVVRTRRLLNSSPASAGVQVGGVVTAVAPRYSGYPVWAPAFAGVGAFRDVGLLGSPHPNPSPEGEGLFDYVTGVSVGSARKPSVALPWMGPAMSATM